MPHSRWKSYVNINTTPLTIFKRPLATFWQSFMVHHHHLSLAHSALNHRCMQIAITNKRGNHANKYPAYNYWQMTISFGSQVLGFLSGRCKECVTRCHIKSVFVRAVVITVTIISNEDCALLRIMRRKSFLSVFGIRVELIWWTGRHFFVYIVQRCLSTSWISLKTFTTMHKTNSWLSPLPRHIGTQVPELESSALVSCAIC